MKYSKKLVDLIPKIFKRPLYELKNKELKQILVDETNFLNYDAPNIERMYYVLHNIFKQEICVVCRKPTKIKKNKTSYTTKCCSVKCSKLKIDESTGNTTAKDARQKAHISMLKIDSESGLSKYKLAGLKTKLTNSKIDDVSGLSIYQQNGIKTKLTNSKIDDVSGLSIYQQNGTKISISKLKIDESTGNTTAKAARQKTHISMLKIDSESGLSKYKLAAIKAANTMSLDLDNDGYNMHIRRSNLTKLQNKTNGFKLISSNFSKDYTLLTTIDEYFNSNRLLKYSCNKCDSIRESSWPYIRCVECYPYSKSLAENEVLEYCQSLSSNVLSNSHKIIPPLELDVYLSYHRLAIEYNGLYWHSSDSSDSENKDYHLNKTNLCREKGIQLFHIFENEWVDPIKQAIWKSIIKNRLDQSSRIYARKTKVAQINSKDKTQFLNDNHLQGDCSSSVNLGLYLGAELVSVMTFGKSRYDKKIDWELLRFCNKLETSVVGGASKLLAAFRRENVGSIISYADKRRSTGNLYKALGFEMSHESKPNYWYYKGSLTLESRIKYQKHKLAKVLEKFDISLTESENMYENGYRKIYDCGNQVWKIEE